MSNPTVAFSEPSGNHEAHAQADTRLTAADRVPGDPFDPASLRLGQDFASAIGVKKVLTTVPCRKPNRHEFVRVRAGEEWSLETGVFEDKVNREIYLVQRDLWAELAGEVYPVCLFLAVNRQRDVFLWPAKLPGSDGRSNTWNESALAAALLAQSKWVRVAANMPGGMYDVYEAAGELDEPAWPELSLSEILKLCFRDRFIRAADHPAIRALRGMA
ncbi:MAG: hypothetical protein WCB27_20580 [Thermoguttaceae bacterium]